MANNFKNDLEKNQTLLEEIIYLAASFLLATRELPRNLAIALKLLQKCLEFNCKDSLSSRTQNQEISKTGLANPQEQAEPEAIA